MDKNAKNRLYIVASAGFAVAGILFLCLSIFTEPKNNTYLCIALASVVLSNLCNVIRAQTNKKQR